MCKIVLYTEITELKCFKSISIKVREYNVCIIGVRRRYAGYATAYPKHRAFFLKLQKINKNYDIFGLIYILSDFVLHYDFYCIFIFSPRQFKLILKHKSYAIITI
jgi:hypothetical protein